MMDFEKFLDDSYEIITGEALYKINGGNLVAGGANGGSFEQTKYGNQAYEAPKNKDTGGSTSTASSGGKGNKDSGKTETNKPGNQQENTPVGYNGPTYIPESNNEINKEKYVPFSNAEKIIENFGLFEFNNKSKFLDLILEQLPEKQLWIDVRNNWKYLLLEGVGAINNTQIKTKITKDDNKQLTVTTLASFSAKSLVNKHTFLGNVSLVIGGKKVETAEITRDTPMNVIRNDYYDFYGEVKFETKIPKWGTEMIYSDVNLVLDSGYGYYYVDYKERQLKIGK